MDASTAENIGIGSHLDRKSAQSLRGGSARSEVRTVVITVYTPPAKITPIIVDATRPTAKSHSRHSIL